MDCGFPRTYEANWTTGRVLGRGACGVVHEATPVAGGTCVETAAVKVIRKDRLLSAAAVRNEVAVMARLTETRCPNAVMLLGAFEDAAHVYLVQTLCTGGDVYTHVASRAYTERDAAACVASVCNAVAHAHLHGVVWLDLKLDNMLLDASGTLRVADWGLARFLDGGHRTGVTRPVGTAFYCAPELLHSHTFGAESDCWSLGVATYILLCGRAPFCGPTERDILARITMDASPPDYDAAPWPTISAQARDFVGRLLCRDPRQRMTAAAALSHPWLAHTSPAEEGRSLPLDVSVLAGLRSFRQAGRMRRLALHALAGTFTREELPSLWEQYSFALHAGEPGGTGRLASALLQQGGIAAADVEALVDELDGRHQGSLSWAQFVAGALRGRHLRHLQDTDPQGWATHVGAAFAALDADADGFLTDAELAARLGSGVAAGASARAEADVDGDGRVSVDEFSALLRRDDSCADFTLGRRMRLEIPGGPPPWQ